MLLFIILFSNIGHGLLSLLFLNHNLNDSRVYELLKYVFLTTTIKIC